jgi:hypothetical protein
MGKKGKKSKAKAETPQVAAPQPEMDAVKAVADFKERQDGNEKLKPCKICARANDTCTECELGFSIRPSSYGCRFFINDEDRLLEIAKAQLELEQQKKTKIYFKMDAMGYLIDAASCVLEHIEEDVDRDYSSVKIKDAETILSHKESKKNMGYLYKGYKEMKFGLSDTRNAYNRYIQRYFDTLFTKEDGKYNAVEYDKHGYNVGYISAFVHLFLEKTLASKENAEKILNFMNGLEGLDILSEIDIKRLLVKV